MKRKINVFDFVMLILSMAMCIGVMTVFSACGPKEDGSWMTCHWAQHAVAAIAVGSVILSIVRFCSDSAVCVGLDFAAVIMSGLMAFIPGYIIPLCSMQTMHCYTMFRPFVIVMAALVIIASIIDGVIRTKQLKARK